ncbi:hypothetical protein [Kibdelosporangium aridum]|uniref:VWFA domain-containing protein n=1 Tax=Kibdelosporangium aridum TaxID=2030 RepID=A0A1W2EXW5_KIBAR|nr:hypothetical protein [Kibdelosporangium aridum]SMD14521.1 hypothetical protein SAMN05661093_05060 [Kibdelosporangium aridum]
MSKKEPRISISHSADLRRFKCRLWVYAAILIVILLLAACSSGTSSRRGELGDNQAILATCDPAAPPASLVLLDGTGSSASNAITAERMIAIESIATRTAVCSGYLRVQAFSSSSAATSLLFDGLLKQDGATDNARLKRVPEAVTGVMDKVRSGYGPAVQALPQTGSDIHAQYRLAAEWIQQLGGSYRLDLSIMSDGIQNVGVDLGARPLSKQEAEMLADKVTVPKLPGASVTVAGLGRVAEGAPPSALAEGLVHYFQRLCERTHAASCTAVSDYATAGR